MIFKLSSFLLVSLQKDLSYHMIMNHSLSFSRKPSHCNSRETRQSDEKCWVCKQCWNHRLVVAVPHGVVETHSQQQALHPTSLQHLETSFCCFGIFSSNRHCLLSPETPALGWGVEKQTACVLEKNWSIPGTHKPSLEMCVIILILKEENS